VTPLAASKADQARIWGSASWQQIAERQLFPVHDETDLTLEAQLGEVVHLYFTNTAIRGSKLRGSGRNREDLEAL
jgi:hypothetical protein